MRDSLSLCNSIKFERKNFQIFHTKNICSFNSIRSGLDKDGGKLNTMR